MRPEIKKEYWRLRRNGERASFALRAAKVKHVFGWLEYNDVARLTTEPDESADLSYLDQQDIFPAKVRKSEYDRADRDGVWGLVGQIKCPHCGNWITVDSCWGFVGDDWKGSGYDTDIMAACIEEIKKTKHC